MNLYLDDDSVESLLVRLLRQAGHDVLIPNDIGLSGADDVIHLIRSAKEDRVFLSHNYRDFRNLHELILQVGGHYPGILMVRQNNDRSRDMTTRDIVRAIAKLEAANFDIADQFVILNQWR